MKKLYILAFFALAFSFNVKAQDKTDDFQFQYKDGTVVADGSVVNCVNVVEDDFNGNNIPSGLFLKNVGSQNYPTAIVGDITSLPQGAIQFCMLTKCNQYYETGTVTKTGTMRAGNTDDLQLEWMAAEMDEMGNFVYDNLPGKTATITLQVEVRNASGNTRQPVGNKVVAYGPAITVNFTWPDPTGITAVNDVQPKVVARYNLRGERISTPQRGVNILRMDNGRTIKQIIK